VLEQRVRTQRSGYPPHVSGLSGGGEALSWAVSCDFTCDAASPAEARRFCAEQLRTVLSDRPATEDVIADAVLVTSELLTNAVRAGCNRMSLELSLEDGALRLAVYDDAPGIPVARDPNPDQPHGRGLAITAQLADRWGYEPCPTGKQVWALFLVHVA
jgi:anti-sigma regulatory factor (Ser/Thr protein kinase)